MDNKAAILVAKLVSGKRFKTFVIGGKAYTMRSPTIKIMCRAISEFAMTDIDFEKGFTEQFLSIPRNMEHITKGLAYLFVGDKDDYEAKAYDVASMLENGSIEELSAALYAFFEMTSMQEVFQVAASAKKYAEVAARTK